VGAIPPKPEANLMGSYSLIRQLSSHSDGSVWLAKSANGLVVLKRASSTRAQHRLLQRAEILSRTYHPNLVQMLDLDPQGRWMVMAPIKGRPLNQWAKGKTLHERIAVLARIAATLGDLHRQGGCHGNLSPSHVLIDPENKPHLINPSSNEIETLGYAAPERLRGHTPTPATDIYSLGCLGYALVTGRVPFAKTIGRDEPSSLSWHPIHSLPLPPAATHPNISEQLQSLLLQMLARKPGARPRKAKTIARTLQVSLQAPAPPLQLGMHALRNQLRNFLVEAMDGGTVLISLSGPRGSGRRTLIAEVLQAARREGLQVLSEPPANPAQIDRPFALGLDASHPKARSFCQLLNKTERPGIVLLRCGASLPNTHVLQVPPLSIKDISIMLQMAGRKLSAAKTISKITNGRPAAVRSHLLRELIETRYSVQTQTILFSTLEAPIRIERLAMRMGLSTHDLLDLIEPLIDRGVLQEVGRGNAVVCAFPLPN